MVLHGIATPLCVLVVGDGDDAGHGDFDSNGDRQGGGPGF